MSLRGQNIMKKVIILGASSGIGRELAKLYSKENHKIAIAGRRIQLLEDLKKEYNNFIVKPFDITQINEVETKLNELSKELDGIDLLIISSGTGDINTDLNFSLEKHTIDTNVVGFTCVCDWAMNYFEKQGSGHLVGITSVASVRGSKAAPSYYASKSYQANYLEGMRQKAASIKKSIYVTDIRPGLVNTDMAKGEGLFWVASVEKVGKQIYRAIENKKKVAYVTKRWRLIYEILKRIPNGIYDKM
jgi:short-subunit dehydrogenase